MWPCDIGGRSGERPWDSDDGIERGVFAWPLALAALCLVAMALALAVWGG